MHGLWIEFEQFDESRGPFLWYTFLPGTMVTKFAVNALMPMAFSIAIEVTVNDNPWPESVRMLSRAGRCPQAIASIFGGKRPLSPRYIGVLQTSSADQMAMLRRPLARRPAACIGHVHVVRVPSSHSTLAEPSFSHLEGDGDVGLALCAPFFYGCAVWNGSPEILGRGDVAG